MVLQSQQSNIDIKEKSENVVVERWQAADGDSSQRGVMMKYGTRG